MIESNENNAEPKVGNSNEDPNRKVNQPIPEKKETHSEDDGHEHGAEEENSGWKSHWQLLLAIVILAIMLTLEFGFEYVLPLPFDLIVFTAAYLLAGYNVLLMAYRKAIRFDFFNEFFLMGVATIGAFAIGSYSEGVAVMAFYSIGEWFQDAAVNRAKRSIKALLDIRPDEVSVLRNDSYQIVNPKEVKAGEIIQVKPGEKVALDGELISEKAVFNTAALTGESKPDTKTKASRFMPGWLTLIQ
jgi:Cd2+/Zn2+-exporting ATPase